MKRKKVKMLSALALSVAMMLAACSSGGNNAQTQSAAEETTTVAAETTTVEETTTAAETTTAEAVTEAAENLPVTEEKGNTTSPEVTSTVQVNKVLEGNMSRPVRVASINLAPGYFTEPDAIFEEMDRVGKNGVDLIVTPEVWTGETAEPDGDTFTSPVLDTAKEKAAEYQTYVVVCMGRYATEEESAKILENDTTGYWQQADRLKFNSCILIDRTGEIAFIYDKIYPYMTEFSQCDGVEMNYEEMTQAAINEEAAFPGDHIGVYECDFGKLGMAICFDMNFPEVWRQMGEAGAELVVWPSAFDGGVNVKTRAAANNYYVVSCTGIGTGGCRVEDVTGEELIYQLPEEGAVTNTVEVTLNLDRTVFHKNFNEGKLSQAQEKYAGKIETDMSYYSTAEWIVAWSNDENLTIQDLCDEYGLVPLRDFKTTKQEAFVDQLRGQGIYWDADEEHVYSGN